MTNAPDPRNPRAVAAGTTCAYCGQPKLDGHQSPEHPIPEVLGSAITVYTVCNDCNSRASREVDKPWLQHPFVLDERLKWELGPRKERARRGHPILGSTFTDDKGHRVITDSDLKPSYPGSIVEHEDGSISIAAGDHDRANELLERLKKRLEREGQAIERIEVGEHEGRPQLTTTVKVSVTSGVRFGAKLGLAFGAEIAPEEWRIGEEAQRLREWLWSDRPADADGNTLAWTPARDKAHPLALPPNHTVVSHDVRGAGHIVATVLGCFGFTIPVGVTSRRAWQSGPTYDGPLVTTMDQLLMEAVLRIQGDPESD